MKKLREVLRILFESDQPGEVAAAASALRKELAKIGRDVPWLVEQLARVIEAPAVTSHFPAHVKQTRQNGEWWKQLEFCIPRVLFLDERESEFITSLYEQWTLKGVRWEPSAKQLRWLSAIYSRLQQPDPFGRW